MSDFPAPPAERRLPPARLQRRRELLLREIEREESTASTEQRRRHRRRLAILVAPLAALSIAAGGYLALQPEDVVGLAVNCFSSVPSVGEDGSWRQSADSASLTVSGARTQADPLSACAQTGLYSTVNPGAGPSQGLTACAEKGAVHVFPSSDAGTCARLGLDPLPRGYANVAQGFIEMHDELKLAFAQAVDDAGGCLGRETADRLAQRVLSNHGFGEWRVVEVTHATGDELTRAAGAIAAPPGGFEGFTAEIPCANGAFAVAYNETVYLEAHPR